MEARGVKLLEQRPVLQDHLAVDVGHAVQVGRQRVGAVRLVPDYRTLKFQAVKFKQDLYFGGLVKNYFRTFVGRKARTHKIHLRVLEVEFPLPVDVSGAGVAGVVNLECPHGDVGVQVVLHVGPRVPDLLQCMSGRHKM